ncbi:Asp-tRNA(Asn)/Glu-tRNA(Gln) amidotransferase subunit GatC [Candidatus Saccharibacteria bacterium]|jgi:aspartyl-tRNA(Asn)/glutamyl-tRNA(Gln) amidotransferase subunit C|nr:Asp-tRNA(Asn)/Glu-tRNA(Gln) amidotransferase subunit GatC [Candidatus Saccharibacteria bacterium]
MKQSASDSQYLAGLSGLALSDAETQALGTDIDNIITYITMLDELDVAGVEPTYQVTDLENVWRKDEVIDGGVTREQLLSLAPETLENQVKVPQVL